MARRKPKHEAFPPGDLIREEIEFRGWTQADLAKIMGRPLPVINQLINGRKAITARTARELEAASGPDAQFWLNMETSYRLYKEAEADPEIEPPCQAAREGSDDRAQAEGEQVRHRPAMKKPAAKPGAGQVTSCDWPPTR